MTKVRSHDAHLGNLNRVITRNYLTTYLLPAYSVSRQNNDLYFSFVFSGNYSCLVAHFYLKRSISFHLIQSYLPSILIVAISWVSFWMDIDAVPGRISLGVITLLAVSSQAGQDKNVPQTSYVKVKQLPGQYQ